ncbi:hypothetical protein [Asticcacaulis sp. YBE204]|uniref:hypothetical protein n=1 Tax=Asticcacaulis sp. YBE204 TaxID=1282363 RepID=UPI0003C3C0DE|nr:hypothetical protein [Asticcacaulis sp. YBE204]ESQ80953.1 hypothetical protein AEYBE204_01120 [Asticcacaulis sp. YBE204]
MPKAKTTSTRKRRVKTPASNLYIVQYAEVNGIGMGRLSDGSHYLTQRGLARLCGVQNAHIGTISRDWALDKPRIQTIKTRLATLNEERAAAHTILTYQGRRQYCYDVAVCQAILAYYAHDAGRQVQAEAALNTYDGEGLSAYLSHMLDGFTVAPEPEAEPLKFQPVEVMETSVNEPEHDAMTRMVMAYAQLSFAMAQAYVTWLRTLMQAAAWNRLGLYVPLRGFVGG